MAFAKKQEAPRISADRLATIAGCPPDSSEMAPAAAGGGAETAARARVELKPDLSRIRPRGINETPEECKRRLAAKTINFSATFIARIAIMGAVGYLTYEVWQGTGAFHRGYVIAMMAMTADFGRVILKAMEPGTK